MIKIRLNPLSSKEETLEVCPKENIQQIFDRAKKKFPQINKDTESYYKAYYYGHEIPRDMWLYTTPKDPSNLLIGIVPEGGSNGRLLGQVAILAVVIATTIATGGTSAAAWAPALAGFTASLIVNSLIKTPDVATGALSTGFNSSESQMYTIDAQSNAIKKYGGVLRVFGRHKVFPTVAALPYTEFFADNNGELSQYFYCIYDFGYGPLTIENIRIGNTPISEFSEVTYRLVDLNKPATDQGPWDTALSNSFKLYKGDNNTETFGLNLNSDSNSGAPSDEYVAIRNAATNTDNNEQEILVQFICPQGLRTIDTQGNSVARNIELTCEFAEVGTENWHSYNDLSQVRSFSSVGQVTEEKETFSPYFQQRTAVNFSPYERYLKLLPVKTRQVTPSQAAFYFYTIYGTPRYWDFSLPLQIFNNGREGYELDTYYYPKGSNTFYSDKEINVDSVISYGGSNIGKIIAKSNQGGYFLYTLDTPFQRDIELFNVVVFRDIVSPGGGVGGGPVYVYRFLNQEINNYDDYIGPTSAEIFKVENLSGRFVISASKQNAVYSTIKFVPNTKNSIKLRVTRVRSYGGATFQIFDDLSWASLNTRFANDAIVTNERHVFLELRIKATDQLNGSVTNLSAEAQSVLEVYDENTDTWNLEQTSNPAWVFAEILTGRFNKRRVGKGRLDTNSILEYAAFCDEIPTPPTGGTFDVERFQSNFILDYKTTVKDLINQVTNQTQASLNIIDGKYGVLIDKLKEVPVQVFTPRNSENFASSKTFSDPPSALKVSYIDSTSDYITREEIVYQDGFNSVTAETFEEIGTFGVTNSQQAWRFGRYLLAQGVLRQETISIDVDFENLVCTRGDYVKLQNDIMKVGGRPARVTSVIGSDIIIDDEFIVQGGINYGYTFRNYLGVFTGTLTITGTDTATLSGPELPQVGDLFLWGEVEKITIDCIIKEIQPKDGYKATLILVEKADAIYSAESTDTLPIYEPSLTPSTSEIDAAPGEIQNLEVVANTFDCDGTSYIYQVQLSWETPIVNVAESYEIYVRTTGEFKLVDVIKGTLYTYTVNQNDLNIEHTFKVLGVSSNGQKITLGEIGSVTATPVRKITPPSNVESLYINVLNETLQLTWPLISDCDVLEYEVRFSPNTAATWESSNLIQTVDRKTNLVNIQGRTGAYFVKARDFNDNQSLNAAVAITSIPSLVDLNIVSETNDFPDLLGPRDRTTTFDSELVLRETVSTPPNIEFNSEGFYYYRNLLTLDDIYIVRLQSLIEAEGFTPNDLMVNWTPLSAVVTMATSGTSDWFVETQYRSTNEINVMAGWVTLDAIDAISEGIQENFTDWRSFTIGDFSGRIFQFRLRLVSNNPSVSPRVFEGKIKADMPDRQVSDNNIIASVAGRTITYDPAFYGPEPSPAVAISIDDAQSGDRFEFTSKNLQGFTIRFYDSGNNPVSRQFDYLVKGYGRTATEII